MAAKNGENLLGKSIGWLRTGVSAVKSWLREALLCIESDQYRAIPAIRRAAMMLIIGNSLGAFATAFLAHRTLFAEAGHMAGLLVGLAVLAAAPRLTRCTRFTTCWTWAMFLGFSLPIALSLVASGFDPLCGVVAVFLLIQGARMQDWRINHALFLLALPTAYTAVYIGAGEGVGPVRPEDIPVLALLATIWGVEAVGQHHIHVARITKRALAQSTLRMVAHDLASPISRTALLAENIRARCIDLSRSTPEHAAQAKEIAVLADRLQRLMEGIGEQITGQIGSAVVDLERQSGSRQALTDVSMAVTRAIDFQCATHEMRRQDIQVRFEAHPMVNCEPNLFGAMVSNLIGNGIRAVNRRDEPFVQGDMSIRVRQETDHTTGAQMVRVVVSDRGVGMDEDEMTAALNPNALAARVRSLRQGETHGVGLMMSKVVLQRLGGRLLCQSVKGQGTTFEIWLPAA